MAPLLICTATVLFIWVTQGNGQNVPCYIGTGCGSGDIGEQATVFECCNMPNTLTYRPSVGSETCLPCYAYGWVQNINSDLTSAEPQADITAVEGETITLTLFFTKNNPANFIHFDFNITTLGTATEGVDYVITPDPAQFISDILFMSTDPVTVNVTLLSDGEGEGSEEIGITLVQLSPVEEFRVLTRPTVTITVRDNDFLTGFIVNKIVISEGDEDEICLETVGAPAVDTVIDVTITYGTAESEDFSLTTSQVTITETNTQPCVRFEVVADSLGLEGVENLTLTLTGPPNVQLTISSVEICIQDFGVGFNPTSYTVTEGVDEFVELIIQVDKENLNVTLSLLSETGEAESDFKDTTKVVALAPGQREERVRVLIIDDSTAEETEIFTAILTTGDIDTPATATVTILDDDNKHDGEEKEPSNTVIAVSIAAGVLVIALVIIIITVVTIKKRSSKIHPLVANDEHKTPPPNTDQDKEKLLSS